MSDKRLYPNTVIFKGTDDNEITYINERVLEQIRAEIGNYYADCSLSIAEQDENCKRCNDTVFTSILHIIDHYTK